MAKFEITRCKGGGYYFTLRAGNGQVVFTSENYTDLASARGGIQSVRRGSANPARFRKLTARDGRPYFTMNAANGEIIGISQMYVTATGRNKGIVSVQKNAPVAEIIEPAAK